MEYYTAPWKFIPGVWGFIGDFCGCLWLSSVIASWILLTADFIYPFLGHGYHH